MWAKDSSVYCLYFLTLALLIDVGSSFSTNCHSDFVPFPTGTGSSYDCVPYALSFLESMSYLEKNLPSFDVTNKGTLGFDLDSGIDGIANRGTNYSLETRSKYVWAANVPKRLFLEYVLPYANINEARTDWREIFTPSVNDILIASGGNLDDFSTADAVLAINIGLWNGAVINQTIVFKSDQTPLIYDPMSVLAFGYASCTGVSVFLINALRAAGIPARLVGTPAWNTVPSNGNHNWVEVFIEETRSWEFIEATPASSGETLANPCDKWFCDPSHFFNGTKVYAARFDQNQDVRYPMAWDLSNNEIPGEDRTEYYQKTCNACI